MTADQLRAVITDAGTGSGRTAEPTIVKHLRAAVPELMTFGKDVLDGFWIVWGDLGWPSRIEVPPVHEVT
ncbi:MAG: hypothetical protein ACRDSP_25825 [Pseudonocardiaceae bacterium]